MTTPVERLLAKLPDAKQAGKVWSACCPAHEDRRPSLSVSEGDNGGAVLHCHAGCEPAAVVAAIGLTLADLMPSRPESTGKLKRNGRPRIAAAYDYRDETGNVLFQAVRYEPKGFRQRRPDGRGGWTWSVKGVRVVPYRLPELLADPARPVLIVEGENDCDNLARMGALATCNAGGAGKWTAEHSAFLRGRRVIVLPDNDEAGGNHAQQLAQLLQGIAERVQIVKLPGLPDKGDVSDWIAAGGTKEELKRLVEAAPLWMPTSARPWPEIDSFVLDLPDFPTHALPDVLRQWVQAESHATQTPADLAGLLALAVCSACIARCVTVRARDSWPFEPVNLFVAVLLAPGNRKSAVFADAMKPLRELESKVIEAARPIVAREQSDRRQDESRLRKLEKTAAEKVDAEARHEAGNLAADLAEQAEPVLPRLIVDDATAEKLGMMLAEQGGRIASMSPEGGVFDLMAGLYSKSGIPQFGVYLMGHSGDDLITDRVSRKSVCVERPALTCAYAMQPAVSGLTIDARQDALTPDLLGRLKAQKADLLTLMRASRDAAGIDRNDATTIWQAALYRLEGDPLFLPDVMNALRAADVRWADDVPSGDLTPESAVDPLGPDGWRTDCIDPNELTPCPKCGTLELWQSVTGDLFGRTPGRWRCMKCDPPTAARRLADAVERIRRRANRRTNTRQNG